MRPAAAKTDCHECFLVQLGRLNNNKTETRAGKLGSVSISVTRLGDLLDFGQLFKALGHN